MLPGIPAEAGGDRRGDRRTIVGGVAKPPVLSRAALRGLCLVCLTAIVYGTLGPLGGGPWLTPVADWRWLPRWQFGGLDDVVTNFAVYVPVGVAFRLLVRRRGRAGWLDLSAGLALSVALSYVTEVAQQAMPARVSSLADIVVNSVAALTGCLCAVPAQRAIRRLHAVLFEQIRAPGGLWLALLGVAVTTTAIVMTTPWTLSWPAARLGFEEPLGLLGVQRFAAFTVIVFSGAGVAVARSRTRRSAVLLAGTGAVTLALFLEGSQAVLHEHVCSLKHLLTILAGIGAGSALAALLMGRDLRAVPASASVPRRTRRGEINFAPYHTTATSSGSPHLPSPSARYLQRVAFVALIAAVVHVVAGLWHFGWVLALRTQPLINWVPFQAEFLAPFPIMLADVIEQLVVYALLTLCCLTLCPGRGRAVALLLLSGLVSLTEAGQAVLGVRGADTTAPVLAALAWLLAVRAWKSLYPQSPPAALARPSA